MKSGSIVYIALCALWVVSAGWALLEASKVVVTPLMPGPYRYSPIIIIFSIYVIWKIFISLINYLSNNRRMGGILSAMLLVSCMILTLVELMKIFGILNF